MIVFKSISYIMKKAWSTKSFGHTLHEFCLIVLTSTMLLSCSGGDEESQNVSGSIPLYSMDNLASVLPELAAEPEGIFEPSGYMSPYFLELLADGKYVVANDRLEQKIHLFDETGTHLASAGGEGRGPGEFMGAMNLHAGKDNDLYVLDVPHHKITRFNLSDEEFIYDTTYSVNQEPGSLLRNIYVTPWGNFGVIRSIVDYSSGEEVYHLYKLDASFNQIERLFEMPGNEKMSLSEWSHVDHMVGQKTLWGMYDEWFYYITSHSPVINRYNLRTGESTDDAWFDLEERKVTPETRDQLMEISSNLTRRFPDLKKTMEAVTVLPLFEGFLVYDETIYLVVFNVSGSDRTEIIRIKKSTGEVHYIQIPLRLWRVQAGNGLIYGIETTDDGSSVRIINLAE